MTSRLPLLQGVRAEGVYCVPGAGPVQPAPGPDSAAAGLHHVVHQRPHRGAPPAGLPARELPCLCSCNATICRGEPAELALMVILDYRGLTMCLLTMSWPNCTEFKHALKCAFVC